MLPVRTKSVIFNEYLDYMKGDLHKIIQTEVDKKFQVNEEIKNAEEKPTSTAVYSKGPVSIHHAPYVAYNNAAQSIQPLPPPPPYDVPSAPPMMYPALTDDLPMPVVHTMKYQTSVDLPKRSKRSIDDSPPVVTIVSKENIRTLNSGNLYHSDEEDDSKENHGLLARWKNNRKTKKNKKIEMLTPTASKIIDVMDTLESGLDETISRVNAKKEKKKYYALKCCKRSICSVKKLLIILCTLSLVYSMRDHIDFAGFIGGFPWSSPGNGSSITVVNGTHNSTEGKIYLPEWLFNNKNEYNDSVNTFKTTATRSTADGEDDRVIIPPSERADKFYHQEDNLKNTDTMKLHPTRDSIDSDLKKLKTENKNLSATNIAISSSARDEEDKISPSILVPITIDPTLISTAIPTTPSITTATRANVRKIEAHPLPTTTTVEPEISSAQPNVASSNSPTTAEVVENSTPVTTTASSTTMTKQPMTIVSSTTQPPVAVTTLPVTITTTLPTTTTTTLPPTTLPTTTTTTLPPTTLPTTTTTTLPPTTLPTTTTITTTAATSTTSTIILPTTVAVSSATATTVAPSTTMILTFREESTTTDDNIGKEENSTPSASSTVLLDDKLLKHTSTHLDDITTSESNTETVFETLSHVSTEDKPLEMVLDDDDDTDDSGKITKKSKFLRTNDVEKQINNADRMKTLQKTSGTDDLRALQNVTNEYEPIATVDQEELKSTAIYDQKENITDTTFANTATTMAIPTAADTASRDDQEEIDTTFTTTAAVDDVATFSPSSSTATYY